MFGTEDHDVLAEEKFKKRAQFESGANWFYWIAGLSLVNSLIQFSGGEWGFAVGLGITQVVDALALAFSEEKGTAAAIPLIALIINILIAGVFIAFGYFARQKIAWAFIVGMIFFALDGVILLILGDILGVIIHIVALVFIYFGLNALWRLRETEKLDSSITND